MADKRENVKVNYLSRDFGTISAAGSCFTRGMGIITITCPKCRRPHSGNKHFTPSYPSCPLPNHYVIPLSPLCFPERATILPDTVAFYLVVLQCTLAQSSARLVGDRQKLTVSWNPYGSDVMPRQS